MLGQVAEQFRIARRGDAVPDPLGAEMAQRIPDRLRTGRLTGVRHAVQPRRAGPREVRGELLPADTDLRATQPEADQSVGSMSQRDIQGDLGGRQAGLPWDVEAPP